MLVSFLSLLFLALSYCSCVESSSSPLLSRRATTIPPPISFPPAQNWEGIDGKWNTFALRSGTPAQISRVLISSTSQQIWVIAPRACVYASKFDSCSDSRGGVFYSNQSSTYVDQGLYDLWIESNLDLTGNAEYGHDVVGLAYDGEGGPTLKNQTIGALAVEDFWLGHFGLHPKPTNFTSFNDPSPSYMSSLRTANLIPSVSWGYTAGAIYRYARVQASLTLGGFDSNRFVANSLTIPLAPDNDRDLLVNINSIVSSANSAALLNSPIYSFVDSTVAEIWLPLDACALFEKAFNLTFDQTTQLYLVSEAQHAALTNLNPNITFEISADPNSSPAVKISFPYAAFDLTASSPYQGLKSDSRYFPLRRAANSTQYTLGRTFLQEAYLIVDWERQNFSISQCSWKANTAQHLVPIMSVNSSSSGSNGMNQATHIMDLGTGAVAGIALGSLALVSAMGVLLFLWYRNNKKRNGKRKHEDDDDDVVKKIDDGDLREEHPQSNVIPKVELDASEETTLKRAEIDSFYKPALVEAPSDAIYELPGDAPKFPEADGRQMSEKEAIRSREERYNGMDTAPSPISPISPGGNTSTSSNNNNAISPVGAQDPQAAVKNGRRRKMLGVGDVVPYREGMSRPQPTSEDGSPVDARTGSDIVSPVEGSGSEGGGVSGVLVSPMVGTPRHKRFSWQ